MNDAVAAKPTVAGFALFTTWAGLEWKTEANWQFGGGASSTFVVDQIVDFCRTKAAFPTTNVAIQVAWGGREMQSFVEWMVTHAIMVSTSDTAGLPGLPTRLRADGDHHGRPRGNGRHALFAVGQNDRRLRDRAQHRPRGDGAPHQREQRDHVGPSGHGVTHDLYQDLELSAQSLRRHPGVDGGSVDRRRELVGTADFVAHELQHVIPARRRGDFGGPNPYGTPFTIGDIVDATNEKYEASHLYVTHMATAQTSVTAALWDNVLPVLQANPLLHTGYPSVYPK